MSDNSEAIDTLNMRIGTLNYRVNELNGEIALLESDLSEKRQARAENQRQIDKLRETIALLRQPQSSLYVQCGEPYSNESDSRFGPCNRPLGHDGDPGHYWPLLPGPLVSEDDS